MARNNSVSLGPRCDGFIAAQVAVVRERYRSLTVGRHEVFSTYDDDHVSIVRVLHVAMDPDHWLG